MINYRHNAHRGETNISWLKSHHSFSFGEYHDRQNMGFGPLRVINEDFVAGGAGFHTHGHANMEIITYVLSGALEHKDSLGSGDVIRPGDVQVMSAGKGILHSEFNPSPEEEVHLLQIWIMPKVTGTRPGYQQKTFSPESFKNRLNLLVSPDGADGSLTMLQDARLWAARLDAGKSVSVLRDSNRKYWLQAARGVLDVDGQELKAGDGLAISAESGPMNIAATVDAEVLVFELPQ
jgi:redox-sensitive bicupin YhaK (pirin superfamily)